MLSNYKLTFTIQYKGKSSSEIELKENLEYVEAEYVEAVNLGVGKNS